MTVSGRAGEPLWSVSAGEALGRLGSGLQGLAAAEAAARLARFGPNRIGRRHGAGAWTRFARQFGSPLVLLLVAAAVISTTVGDRTDAAIILAIVAASGAIGFWQETTAEATVRELLRRVGVRVAALRDGAEREVAVEELVPGDVVVLAAGSVIPADLRLLDSTSLYVDQAVLTGETFPAEKSPRPVAAGAALAERSPMLYAGCHVVSGTASAVVVATGGGSELGRLASRLERRTPAPAFERGLRRFGLLLLRITALLLAAIFVATVALDHPVLEALLFALALAVGITPELLPAIVAVNLARGARRMAADRLVVKRLAAIEDLGAMDVLCSDKTGTLTEGTVRLRDHVGPDGEPSPATFLAAALNAHFQRGLPSPIDETIRAAGGVDPTRYRRLGEIPYDFTRKRLSVLVEGPEGRRLVTKGALARVLEVCAEARLSDGRLVPLAEVRDDVERRFAEWSALGLRVLGVAERGMPGAERVVEGDEAGLVLLGMVTFSDVPKEGVTAAIEELRELGISLRIITGDNRRVATTVAREVGFAEPRMLTGTEIAALPAAALAARAERTDVFAEVEPIQKERILRALQRAGHVVGYIGDGINDAPALHVADVGISVDRAADVAKQAAEIVMLDHDLRVLAEGVRQGRTTFLNTLKYIYVTTSANFSNMISMALAVLFLPFLPMLPMQILLINFLSDFPAMTLGSDRVDAEAVLRPRRWEMRSVRNFMVIFGLIGSVFDLGTFALLILVFRASAEEFRTAWFAVSLLTEIVILLVMRTQRPFTRSRPAPALLAASIAVAGLSLALPFLPAVAGVVGFEPLPPSLLAVVFAVTAAYALVSETAKRWFFVRSRFAEPWAPP